ncbi:MAG TPA: hemolysin III family protein [Candidatus Limnocylindria bacterium]|jgi:hemolysin III|nr:hemolysin III family protein [Candidatus Limnocylindria bacterium]
MREKPPVNATTHGVASIAAAAGAVFLLVRAWGDVPKALVLGIYGVSVTVLFAASASYHAITRWPRLTAVLRRIDHASIFLMIAGTYTPVLFFGLRGTWRSAMLGAIWTIAAVAIFVAIRFVDAPRALSTALYLALGWAALVPSAKLVAALPPPATALIALGGVLYTAGALVYATKRPNLFPNRFGFHEVFHLLVVAAAGAQYAAVAGYLAPM